MLQAGKSQIEIARKLGVSEAAVSVWKKQIDEGEVSSALCRSLK